MTLERRLLQFVVTSAEAGWRLDLFLSAVLRECSRNRAADLIRTGAFRVSGAVKKPGYRLQAGEQVDGSLPDNTLVAYQPEPIPLEILFEDSHLLVINKKQGIVVHPAPGHPSGTLVNALLHHCTDLAGIGGELRPGIVHRLDKDTSGALVVAKTEAALNHLAAQFKQREVAKTYLALVHGVVKENSGEILLPIGRHQVHRKLMSVQSRHSRTAHTQWMVKERFAHATLLEVLLKTGRTHQIRVHCAAVGHPILGDEVYGGGRKKDLWLRTFSSIRRQMLHAWRLIFVHPATGQEMEFECAMPEDMADVIAQLRSALP